MSSTQQNPANGAVLEGTLVALPEFRFTPAGRLVAFLEVEHLSQESAAAHPRRIELRMPIQALGAVAEQCRALTQGTWVRVEGCLNQKRWIRDGKVRWGRTELLAQHIQILEKEAGSATKER